MPIHDWTRVEAGIFHDFHHEWITTIKHAVNQELKGTEYYALAEQIAGGLGPDVLTLKHPCASYPTGAIPEAFVEPVAVGDALPNMPLFLTPDEYVLVPLEKTYEAAFDGVPDFWRAALEPKRKRSKP